MNQLVIFDFDGVLVDTEYTTFEYYKEKLPSYGIELKESDFVYKMGRKSIDFFRDVLGNKFDAELVDKLIKQKRQAFLADVKRYLKPVPGGFELLKKCRDEGLKLVLGSQNERELIEIAVDEYNIRQYFSAILSIQDISNKKPDPELFLLALKKAGVPAGEAVVIEDSPDGIKAANNAGIKVIGITSSFEKEKLAGADKIAESMRELTPDYLKNF